MRFLILLFPYIAYNMLISPHTVDMVLVVSPIIANFAARNKD